METISVSKNTKKQIQWEVFGVRLSAIFTSLMGIINLTSAVQPALQARLAIIEKIIPLEILQGSRMTSALAGFALLLLADSLWRRKRTAWFLTILLLFVSMITHLVKGLDFEEASATFGLLVLLVLLRHSFHASTDKPSLRQGLFVLAVAFAFTMVYGAAGFFLLDRHFKIQFSLAGCLASNRCHVYFFLQPRLGTCDQLWQIFHWLNLYYWRRHTRFCSVHVAPTSIGSSISHIGGT